MATDGLRLNRAVNILDPNDPDSHLGLALALTFAGDPQAAIPAIERARRLDPLNKWRFAFAHGLALLGMDRASEAAEVLRSGLAGNPDNWEQWLLYTAAVALADDDEEASRAVDRLKDLKRAFRGGFRSFSISYELDFWGFKTESDRDRIAAGLRKAGMPE